MITKNNIKNLKIIVGNLAYKDYIQAYHRSNIYKKGKFTKTGRERKFEGYSLSAETLEAYELLLIATNKATNKISIKEGEEIKKYLLKIKLTQSELLIPKKYE